MNDRRRLEQLHVMLDRLGRMPASRDRDFMLREVRARIVDVESGERPEPMRLLAPETEIEITRVQAPKQPKPARPRVPSRVRTPLVQIGVASIRPAPPLPTAHDRVDLLLAGGRMSLDDEPDEPDDVAPWARGLRA